jgi:hypothetical protein
MFVIRLPNGNLRVPHSVPTEDGRVIAHGYIEIGPDDPDYQRLAAEALTEAELEERRRRWRSEDEALRLQFEEWRANSGD